MNVVRVYTGEDNQTHFEDLVIPARQTRFGLLSAEINVGAVSFRETPGDALLKFRPSPRRQFVIALTGRSEVECSDGTKRRFGPGDILLADDPVGPGHIVRELEGPLRTIFIPLPDDLDLAPWRA